MILYDIESLDEFRTKIDAEVEKLKIALVSANPERLHTLFPQYAPPSAPSTATEIDRGLATNAPMEIQTVMSAEEALAFLDDNALSLAEMDQGTDY